MSGILSVGTRALQTNQAVLQTTGHNIANVNTAGYSRQSVILSSVAGQFSGAGYYGKGVEAVTVERIHSEFLTRQASLSSSTSAADTKVLEQLRRLEGIFQGGPTGLGAAVSDMLNSFSDVANAPTDLTARSVALARVDETASRFRAAATRLNEMKQGVALELKDSVTAVNNLAKSIAATNSEISRALGAGQTPNDLLDKRDQLIADLNQYVQTTSIAADDGTVGIFLAGSQPLVLGTVVSPVSLADDEFGDPSKTKLAMQRGSTIVPIEESMLGGGTISGLLRFQNTDLANATNMLGRMALAIGTATNEQHRLGLDLNGNAGGDLFNVNTLPNGLKAASNAGIATLQVSLQGPPNSGSTAMVASNYQVSFTGAATGTITRLSDGQSVSFATSPIQIDGLNIAVSAGAVAGDRFLITPFRDAAATISSALSSAASLAVASPVAASAGNNNQGTLSLASLAARSVPAPAAVTLTFTAPGTYTRSDTGATTYAFVPGQAIEYNLVTPGATGWSLTLQGSAQAGDSFTIAANAFPRLNAGNAQSMMALRDVAMFDGATLTDGYASVMSSIGVRVQSADFAAQVSKSIATSIEQDRANVSGVNLDEEAAKLLQYQQAYQASAKMMQVAQGIFDTLLQTISR